MAHNMLTTKPKLNRHVTGVSIGELRARRVQMGHFWTRWQMPGKTVVTSYQAYGARGVPIK